MNTNVNTSAALPANGESSVHDLFALTDEQILEIEPETQDFHPRASEAESAVISSEARNPSSAAASQSSQSKRVSSSPSAPRNDGTEATSRSSTGDGTRDTEHAPEPPPWLAAQMKDPWTGQEARELWNGVQQAKSEAAAYRAAFENPEDARALKELYPGGVNEARAAAERARVLDDIDRAYFGAAGKSAQEVSASRAQLAQQMLCEDPAAFREMVFAGLRALEESGTQTGSNAGARFSATSAAATLGATLSPRAEARGGSPGVNGGAAAGGGAGPAPAVDSVVGAPAGAGAPAGNVSANEAHLSAYAAFEKAANEDLERSVGGAIERTLQQALPNVSRLSNDSGAGAHHASSVLEARPAPLQARLSAAIRQDVEGALKGDRQLSEQVAQILSGRRLDNETRGQVVRLIGERAQQLVPIAAKRVLNDWTQTTLAAHRGKSARAEAASTRREVAPASSDSRSPSLQAGSTATSSRDRSQDPTRTGARPDTRRVDYRKLSDEQILDL